MADQATPVPSQPAASDSKARNWLIFGVFGLLAAIIFGVLYLFVIAPAVPEGNLGWYLFSFATGLTMIVLPCTLPLAFVIVPLSMGKGMVKGLGMAISFGVGIAVTLSLYGVAAALLGGIAIDALGADLESIKNWVYFVAGSFAVMFALSEIGLLNVHMPTYSGAAPAFIQKRSELIKAFLLGLFLGNVGVGCPHPATPLILIEIASSGDVLYGWSLFLIHAVGRILPLLVLAFLAILGVNGLSWLLSRKDAVEKATGWAMVFVAGFILTLGLFSHDWWVNSGLHSGLETLTQEAYFNELLNETLDQNVEHLHGLETGQGLFGLPLELGSWFLVTLWILPMIMWYRKRKREITDAGGDPTEMRVLAVKRNFLIVIAIFIVLVFTQLLPNNFYYKSVGGAGGHHDGAETEEHPHDDEMMDHDMSAMGMGTAFSTDTAGLPYAKDPELVSLSDGDTYDITAGYIQKEVGNRTLRMLAYNGSVPGPFIKAPQGAEVTINFTNNSDLDQTIHSHGLRLDNTSDGVPGVTQDVVKPGESFVYTLSFPDAGVYWYHPHTRDDYGQEMGLYGNYLVEPSSGYNSDVNREMPIVIDDILIVDDKIANFYKEYTNFALIGRFGNEFLVNGEKEFSTTVQTGEVVRMFVTNVSNARTYNLSIPGAEMKLIAADVGRFEREVSADDFLISPAERMIVEVYFENPGTYELTHTMPDGEVVLSRFEVSGEPVEDSFAGQFSVLNVNQDVVDEFATFRDRLSSEPDKKLLLTVKLMGEVDHSSHGTHNAEPEADTTAATGQNAIQWEDPTQSDAMNMTHNVEWMLVDQDTGKVSMDIDDWTFTVGDLVKVRITNDSEADHEMQHPIHLHGQQFVVLSENGVPNNNMAWKDTALVLPGEYIDVLVDMSNPGVWMAHCHISEHLHAGMMMQFRVEDENGAANGDAYRATVPETEENHFETGMMDDHDMGSINDHDIELMEDMMDHEDAPEPLLYNFDDHVADTEYNVSTDISIVRAGKEELITLSFTDAAGNSMLLDENIERAVTVTFVKNDNSMRFVTYPGNTNLESADHGEAGHDNSDGHHDAAPVHDNSDGHHGFNLIPRVYAHGGVEDGHELNTSGRTYSVPVVFPAPGVYRGFVEFTLAGESEPRIGVINIEVSGGTFSVDNFGWSPATKWWVLFIVSLLLIVPLVMGVRKYINVEKV